MTVLREHFWCLLAALFIGGGMGMGCDQVSPADLGTGDPPLVGDVLVQPDTIRAETLRPDQVQDSLARIPLAISAALTDPDGQVERVVFTVQPASNPRGTASGSLAKQGENLYRRQIALRVPVGINEVYTVRVFAVDNDSLESNQAVGQFRFIPED